MPVVGITGGISTGKSTFFGCVHKLLPEARFFDADAMARQLTQKDGNVLAAIREQFGLEVFSRTGELNRAALRAIVFGAPEKRRALEHILHPPIRAHWSAIAAQYRSSSELFFADIPLLYETNGEKLCDRVVVVVCSPKIQIERLIKRTGMSETDARAMITAQMPLEEKIRRADHVVWNNGPATGLTEQAELLVSLWKASL